MADKTLLQERVEKYRENVDRQKELDASLFAQVDRLEWVESLKERAIGLQSMSAENEDFIQFMQDYLQRDLTDAEVEELGDIVYNLYWDGYEDYVVLCPMVEKLIGCYEKTGQIDKLILMYGILFYEENEIRNRADGLDKMEQSHLYKVFSYREYYTSLDEKARKRFWTCYYNLIVVGIGNKSISVDESYEKLTEMYEFWRREEVQALDGENEEIIDLIKKITVEWLVSEEGIEEASETTKNGFCEIAEHFYEESMRENEDLLALNSELYAAYLHACLFHGTMTADEIIDAYMKYYEERLKHLPTNKNLEDEDFYFVINAPLTLERWLHLDVSPDKTRTVVSLIRNGTYSTWYDRLEAGNSAFVNELLADWCTRLMPYLETQEEKEEWIFQLLVRRQLTTYLHSVMVKNIAEAVYKEVVRKRPELFEKVADLNRGELPEYVRKCALLHDVGKTKITDIVNMQSRKLTDREFQGIKRHTIYGAEMIDIDAQLARYHDIVIGHHKFYNGKGGYPEEYDNTASEYRIIIDLITISDCIDAATDQYGRNYKSAKSLEVVLEELVRDSGSRYNPDLVQVIAESPRLKRELAYITEEGRVDIMYRAYLERVESE